MQYDKLKMIRGIFESVSKHHLEDISKLEFVGVLAVNVVNQGHDDHMHDFEFVPDRHMPSPLGKSIHPLRGLRHHEVADLLTPRVVLEPNSGSRQTSKSHNRLI
jgi:hypothetical protein